MGSVHTLIFILLLSLGDPNLQLRFFECIPYMRNTSDAVPFLEPTAQESSATLQFTGLCASFSALSAFFHFGNALAWRDWYLCLLSECICPSRWIEYFFSASIMVGCIAYPAGAIDLVIFVLLMIMTGTTMTFGFLTEVLSRPTHDPGANGQGEIRKWKASYVPIWVPHVLGYIPMGGVWWAIMFLFHGGSRGREDGQNPPDFVFGIVYSELALYMSFACVQAWVLIKGPDSYVIGECVYQWLSLVSKCTLSTVLLANVLFLGG